MKYTGSNKPWNANRMQNSIIHKYKIIHYLCYIYNTSYIEYMLTPILWSGRDATNSSYILSFCSFTNCTLFTFRLVKQLIKTKLKRNQNIDEMFNLNL